MFVREIKNKNGKTYIQVIEKITGKYILRKSFGSATSATVIKALKIQAKTWIQEQNMSLELDFNGEKHFYEQVISSINSLNPHYS